MSGVVAVLADVLDARARHRDHPEHDDRDRALALFDALGDVTSAVLRHQRVELREKLIATAALAVAWAEHLDEGVGARHAQPDCGYCTLTLVEVSA